MLGGFKQRGPCFVTGGNITVIEEHKTYLRKVTNVLGILFYAYLFITIPKFFTHKTN